MLSMYRALDLSDDRGLLCGHILAELGAEVVHVEPPGGAPRTPAWLAYTRGSRSAILDLDSAEGAAALRELVKGADLLIESADPGTWEAKGLGYEQLRELNPALVWVSITAFGSDGPKASYAATDLVVQAAAGAMDICGPPDRAPLRTAGVSAFAHACAEAAGGALIALTEARRSGLGQRVEVSAQRAANLPAFFTLQNDAVGHKRLHRAGNGFAMVGVTVPFVWEAADGFVSLTVALDPVNKPFLDRLLGWMREEGAADADLTDRDWHVHLRTVRAGEAANTDLARLVEAIGAFLRGKTKAELLSAALDRRLLLVPVSTFDDMLDNPQLDERGYWAPAPVGEHGETVKMPAHIVRGLAGSRTLGAAPPQPGQHTAEVLAETRRPAFADLAPSSPAPPAAGVGPLAGLKVLDFMWVMAGPTSTGVLAQYGATVVRVENAARMDGVRLLAPYYGGKAGRETSAAFASINLGKLSVTLDPNNAAAREVIYDLVRWADVVTESFSPRAMRAWGLDYDSLRRLKPDLVMLSSCLFGQEGPYAFMAGYGTMGAAIGGMVQPTGWPDQPPMGPYGAYTDACAPRMSVAAVLAAVEHRRQTGEGVYVDQSQIEASLHYLLPAILDHQLNGASWDRRGNDDDHMSPHGVFPSAGDDEWVAIAVRDRRDWQALCGAIGRPDWAEDPSLAEVEGRRATGDKIDQAIAAWTALRTPEAAERELQALGVPAHAVLHSGSPQDPQLTHLGHTVVAPHTGQGERLVERTRIQLTRTPPVAPHVPALGEHTEQVLRDLLGYDDARIAELRRAGALGGERARA
ncbi:MAG: CoA transferase [Acidimicrobiales bacterium]